MNSGTMTSTSHEPQPIGKPGMIGSRRSMKLVLAAMIVTRPVAVAPMPLTTDFGSQCRPFNRRQCWTMPACDSVNAVKTATA